MTQPGDERHMYSMQAFGALFAEVAVDRDFGLIRMRRLVGAYGVGRVVNPRMTRSQAIGGMVGGIGMALMEHTITDRHSGRIVHADLANYLVPVNADVAELDALFVEEDDPYVNPLGVKDVGELALVGVAPANPAAGAALPIGRVRTEGERIWWLDRSAAGLPPE